MKIQPGMQVEETAIYRRFDDLACRLEEASRGFGNQYRWLRFDVLKSSSSICAYLTDQQTVSYTPEFLYSLYHSNRQVREAMNLVNKAGTLGLLPDAGNYLEQYSQAITELNELTGLVESHLTESSRTTAAQLAAHAEAAPHAACA